MEEDSSLSKLANRQLADWEKWARDWALLIDTSRPSQGDLTHFGRLVNDAISKKQNPNIVILGSTPELRDLCSVYSEQYEANVTCVELVEGMYKAMTQLVFKPNKKEKVVFSNWLSIGLPDNFADIIIGDLTEGNIPFNLRDKYFLEMKRILKNGGKYITRATAYIAQNKAKPMITYADILEKLEIYKKKVLNGESSMQKAASNFGGELVWDAWYKSDGKLLSMSVYKEEIEELDKTTDPTIKSLMDSFHRIYDVIMDKYWDYDVMKIMLSYYHRHFIKVKCYYSKDYPTAKYTPVFEMTKK